MSLDFTDIFCGAGGSSIGLVAAGLELKLAANHWDRAIETHSANFRDAGAGAVNSTGGFTITTSSGNRFSGRADPATGFLTGTYVVLTPVIGWLFFRHRIGGKVAMSGGQSGEYCHQSI